MNWVALHTNPLWREFWSSKEIKDKREMLERTLLYAKLEPEQRGIVRGRLMQLQEIERQVKANADRQQKEIEDTHKSVIDKIQEEFANELPRVF